MYDSIFQVDNNKVSPLAVSEAYNIYTFKESNWAKTDKRYRYVDFFILSKNC